MVYDEKDQQIAYFEDTSDGIKLIICDIFSPEKKYVIQRNFSSYINPANCIRFLCDNKIYLNYDKYEINEEGQDHLTTGEEIVEYIIN